MSHARHSFSGNAAQIDPSVREPDACIDLGNGFVAHRPTQCTFAVGLRDDVDENAVLEFKHFEAILVHCCRAGGEPAIYDLIDLVREAVLMYLAFLSLIVLIDG